MAFFLVGSQSTTRDLRGVVATFTGLVVVYCVTVLWYVATFPDVGLRCLLPDAKPLQNGGIQISQWVAGPDENADPKPRPGDQLVRLNGQEIGTFLDFVSALQSLRFAKIPPGGQLAPGSDPAELKVPPLVEVFSREHSRPPERLVEIVYRNTHSSQPLLENRIYVPVRPIAVSEVSVTIFWFACQLSILAVALTSYWYRPFDLVSQNFCLMCCASMGAFVAGFHWWVLARNPLLNIPFIVCAASLPALVMNFFLVFPRESELVRTRRTLIQVAVLGPVALMTFLLVIVYWSSWSLNGSTTSGHLNVFQKLAVLTQIVFRGSAPSLVLVSHATELLHLLRSTVYAAIGLACVYFLLIVCKLVHAWFTIEAPRERQQVSTILGAALLSTIPIGYTLYLAFFQKIEFALGRAQIPMFIASMLFMAAYSHGMFRHRLMLAEDPEDKGRRYILMSLLVSGGFATFLALGGVAAHSYSLPLNSSTTQEISLFLILLLAAGITLWVRDRLQTVVDRRFFSEKYQLDRAMQQLNRSAAYLTEPSGMADITLKTCQDVMDATSAMMFVRDGQGSFRLIGTKATSQAPAQLKPEQVPVFVAGETVIRRIPQANRDTMVPVQRLLHDLKSELLCVMEGEGGVHGVIILGRRRSGGAYTAEDIAFLHAIAQMSVLALHSSRANQTMAQLDAELKMKMDRIAEQQRQMAVLRAELTSLQRDAGQAPVVASEQDFDREGIRGSSTALLTVLSQVKKVARSPSTVLIRGESGTGKELLARVIHRNSDRAAENLVCVNCAALSSSLLESELFGHVKGAYTGAHIDKAGRFMAADKGTLFLDEIGDISAETQVKLLRVLQERCFEAVGSDKTVHVDVRVIAATNRNLEDMISRGQFRADLFYRLNVVSLTLPPLRERPEDLAELVFFFLSRSAQKTKKQIRQIDPNALAAIEAHEWPGNIRELENVIERAVVLADSDMITMTDLPDEFQTGHERKTQFARLPGRSAITASSASAVRSVSRRITDGEGFSATSGGGTSTDSEEQLLREALRVASGNKALAARRLNLPRSTFFSKCRKYGIG